MTEFETFIAAFQRCGVKHSVRSSKESQPRGAHKTIVVDWHTFEFRKQRLFDWEFSFNEGEVKRVRVS